MDKIDELKKMYANECAMLGDCIFNAIDHFMKMKAAQEKYVVLTDSLPRETEMASEIEREVQSAEGK